MLRFRQTASAFFVAFTFDNKSDGIAWKPEDIGTKAIILLRSLCVEAEEIAEPLQSLLSWLLEAEGVRLLISSSKSWKCPFASAKREICVMIASAWLLT